VLEAGASVGYPAVIKPINLAGSVHVSKVVNEAELRRAYDALRADERRDLGRQCGSTVLVEAYVTGPEYSVEGYLADGTPQILSITEKFLGPEPHFVELGHIVEADLPGHRRAEIQRYVGEVLRALEITLGAFHAELRLADDGPVLMEVGARLPGDHICELIQLARGVSLPDMMIRSHLGNAGPARPGRRGFAGVRYVTAPDLGFYTDVTGLEELRALPGFQALGLDIGKGETIAPATDFRGRVGYAIFTAPTYAALRARLMRVDELVRFECVPDPGPREVVA
jgi:biotin carboxylase